MLPLLLGQGGDESRQKSGLSGTTRPQTKWELVEKRWGTSPEALSDDLE